MAIPEGSPLIYLPLTLHIHRRTTCVCSEFVVSIISDWFVEAANHTCGSFPPEVDEMELSGLTPAKSTIVSPPRVKESGMNMECKVRERGLFAAFVGTRSL